MTAQHLASEAFTNAATVFNLLAHDIEIINLLHEISDSCISTFGSGGKLILAGNGGSFSDALHISAEFIARLRVDRKPLPSVVLGSNLSALTAIGNDYSFEQIFSRELEALASPRDIFVPITTSGKSPNILQATEKASEIGLTVYPFTSSRSSQLHHAFKCIKVPSTDTMLVQQAHIACGHIICDLVEQSIVKSGQVQD